MALPPIQQRLQELRSQTQTPTQPPSQNGGVRVPIQDRIAQLRSQQKVEPTIEEQKQALREQGQAVSVRSDRAEPTFGGQLVRGIVKPFVSAATTVVPAVRSITEGNQPFEQTYRPVKTKYLGDVYSPGAKGIVQLSNAKNVGDVVKGTGRATADIAGKAVEIASYAMTPGAVTGLRTLPAITKASIEGAKLGAAGGFGVGLQGASEAPTIGAGIGEIAKSTALGGLTGGALGGFGAGIGKGINNVATRNAPEVISANIDNSIRDIFKGTTGDIQKINDSAFKSRKGLELLNKEAPNIQIPDESAPLGTRVTKPFDLTKAKPNELLSGVKEMDNLIVSKMKKATEDARSRGFEISTNDAKLIIQDAIENGDVAKASGERMLKQIDSIGNDPVKAHDWVQDVNMKYKKKYERGTIEDTAIGSLADDVAQVLRDNLDLIVDRKGYAEAYGNNQELKRMLVAIAKKANRQVDWGDITTDAGLDAAISILTGNPAYMARTVATSMFKNVWNKFRNNAGLRSFRNAVKNTAKVGTETRLPYSVAKPQFKSKNLLPEGKGFENKAGIQLGKPKVPTTFEPRAKVVNTQPQAKQLALPAPKNVIELPKNVTKATLGSDATENALMRNTADRRKLINKPKTRIISEETYKKALKNLGDTSTLNSTPIHLSKDALIVAGYHIENGVRSAVELGVELAKKGYKFTKEQLEELYKNAQKNLSNKIESVNVGLSAVKGKVTQQLDKLADAAQAAFEAGNFDEANKIYNQITQEAQKTVRKRFMNTGIEIKMKGTGFGVYQGTPEPNIDFIANVPKGKEELFNKIMTDISQNDFKQDSFLTYKDLSPVREIGVIDKAKGIINEPMISVILDKPMTLDEIAKVNKALSDSGLEAMSIKDGGKRIDLIHLTAYNGTDYEKWIKQSIDFNKNLERDGISGTLKQGVTESRFIGSDTSGANTTYEQSRSNFSKTQKGFINNDTNSKVLDLIQYRKDISKKELESIVNSGDISPTEKTVFKEVLNDIKSERPSSLEIQGRLKSKLLTLDPKLSDQYASYGFDNLNLGRFDKYQAVVFDSNLKHGNGQGHYKEEGIFGHSRYALDKKYDNIAYIAEIQSDVFQDNVNVKNIKNFYEREKEKLGQLIDANKYRLENAQKRLDDAKSRTTGLHKNSGLYKDLISNINDEKVAIDEAVKTLEDLNKRIGEINSGKNKQYLIDQFVNFSKKDKYRDRLMEETINYINKTDKPEKIRIATPSTAAKIEGFANTEDLAPYTIVESRGNGRIGTDADDLEVGDIIDSYGGNMVVVDTPAQGRGWGGPAPRSVVAAEEGSITRIHSLNDAVEENARTRFDDYVKDELKDELSNGITPEKAQELLDNGSYDYATDLALKDIASGDKIIDESNIDDVWDNISSDLINSENEMMSQSEIAGMYGVPEENVFFNDISRGRGYDYEIIIVDGNIETFEQPSAYSAFDEDALMGLDEDQSLAKKEFSDTQNGVLENYYKIKNEFIPKLEKEYGIKAEIVTDNSGNSWIEIDPKTIKKTVFGLAPLVALPAIGKEKKKSPLPTRK